MKWDKVSTVKLSLLFFAGIKEKTGRARIDVEIPADLDVAGLRAWLCKEFPDGRGLIERCVFAVGDQLVDNAFALKDEMEVAVIPPVSGG